MLKAAILFLYIIFTFIECAAPAFAGENPDMANAEKVYQRYCATCHGDRGDGNGFNAKNLDPRPANHTDAALMFKRTDRELIDAISGGGRAVGKAAIMPPWGNTLDKTQIRSLVRHIRRLCRCEEE